MTQWGPIIDHNGGACPLEAGTVVRVFMSNGQRFEGILYSTDGTGWDWNGPSDPFTLSFVLAYQLQRPKGLQLLDAALSALPADQPNQPARAA